jgi:dCTP deaminase
MSFWSTEKLRERLPILIDGYNAENVKNSAYELAVGPSALVTADGKPEEKKLAIDGVPVEIPPGQFGLLLTEEVVRVPSDAIAFISIRASVKFKGLINVSGFHIDPGYNDRLKFSIYNAGARPIYLKRGQRIFMVWYADLDQQTLDLYEGTPGKNTDFGPEDYQRMEGEVASPGQLKKELEELRRKLEAGEHKVDTWGRVLAAFLGGVLLLLMKDGCSKPAKNEGPSVVVNQSLGEPLKISTLSNRTTAATFPEVESNSPSAAANGRLPLSAERIPAPATAETGTNGAAVKLK